MTGPVEEDQTVEKPPSGMSQESEGNISSIFSGQTAELFRNGTWNGLSHPDDSRFGRFGLVVGEQFGEQDKIGAIPADDPDTVPCLGENRLRRFLD